MRTLVALLALSAIVCGQVPCAVDQAQAQANYGFWLDLATARWQEFRPAASTLCQVDVMITKAGSPGDLVVDVQDAAGSILRQIVVPQNNVASGWNGLVISPPLHVVPGASYHLQVSASQATPNPQNRYFWRGLTAVDAYRPGQADVESTWPGFDFAFRVLGDAPRPRHAEYWPLQVGNSWTLTPPSGGSLSTRSLGVVASTCDGPGGSSMGITTLPHPAGTCPVWPASNDGVSFGVRVAPYYPFCTNPVPGSQLPDIILGEVVDGETFATSFTESVLIRDWDVLRPLLAAIPGALAKFEGTTSGFIDPAAEEVVAWVWFDGQFVGPPSSTDAELSSGLPAGQIPSGSVTEVCFYQPGQGPVAIVDIDAGTGLLTGRLGQTARFSDCNGNGTDDLIDLSNPTGLPALFDIDENGIPDGCDQLLAPLTSDSYAATALTGGQQNFQLEASVARAGNFYFLLGSLTEGSGSPLINAGPFVLPLVDDWYFQWTLYNPNTPLLTNSAGFLSPSGSASATFNLPPLPACFAGTVIRHAYAVFSSGSLVMTSNAVPLVLH